MIDPDIWQDEKMSKLDFIGRLVFIGLITQANDYGKLRGNCKLLKSVIFPYDESVKSIEKHINQLAEFGMITLYSVNGEQFIKLTNWDKYQKLEHPSKDSIPEPSHETIMNVSRDLPAQVKLSKEKLREVKRSSVFTPPTLEEVKAFVQVKGLNIDPVAFFSHYEANGWVQGHKGKPVVNWKACCYTWVKNEVKYGKSGQRPKQDLSKYDRFPK